MHLEAHAGVGWAIGVLAPGSDRRLRNLCLAAAVLPDVDAIAYLWGFDVYAKWHHTFGHNVTLGLLCTAVAWRLRGVLGAVAVALAFASHLVSDMKLSAYPVHLLWPWEETGLEFTPNLGLADPINTRLVYGSAVFALVLAVLGGPTPFDVLSSRLDRIVRNVFRKKVAACSTCSRRTNEACDDCGTATCLRHARVDLRFRIHCPACTATARASPPPS